jgi:F420-dependent oxidoreductase-like protein
MRFGVHYANFSTPGGPERLVDTLLETARTADEGGVDLFTVMDHWYQAEFFGGADEPMLEAYTTLGALSQVTSRVRLSVLVTGVTYRYPGLLAKIVTTLDVLSRGRAMLGLGAAWYEREHAGLGVPFPPLKERFDRLEETLQICRQMFSDDTGPYEGTYYQLAETLNVPRPVRGSVPIMVGGGGEKRTLRLLAQYADASNIQSRDGVAGLERKLEVLRRHCDDVGRDYDAIEKGVSGTPLGDPLADTDGFLRQAQTCAALGAGLVTFSPPAADPVGWVSAVCERVVPRLAEIG